MRASSFAVPQGALLSTTSSLTTIQFPSDLSEFGNVLEPAWRSAHSR